MNSFRLIFSDELDEEVRTKLSKEEVIKLFDDVEDGGDFLDRVDELINEEVLEFLEELEPVYLR